jgi:hypothetical protein
MTRNEQIISDRVNNNMTLEQLRAKYTVSLTQLSRILRAAGATRDGSHPCSRIEWLKPRLDAGRTIRELCVEAGVPYGTMRLWIRRLRGADNQSAVIATSMSTPPVGWDSFTWFDQQYNQKYLGMSAIAGLIGRSVGFVSGKLKEYGIERRSHKQAMAKFRKRPVIEWLQEHYIDQQWSIEKCAAKANCSWETIFEALRDDGFQIRDASEQHRGELNEFYGRIHTKETRKHCAAVGAKAGAEYWVTGDVEAKKRLQSELTKLSWSDPARRERSSALISELCRQGKCNSRAVPYHAKSGITILLKSSWEVAVASFLDSCSAVKSWAYEDVILQYLYDECVHNFVVDFVVEWIDGLSSLIECKNKHLLESKKEQAKIATLIEQDNPKRRVFIIDSPSQVKELLLPYQSLVKWRQAPLYEVHRDYLKSCAFSQEAMLHEIVAGVCPWSAPTYPTDELAVDLKRLKNENVDSYWQDNVLRATAPNSGGMPGRVLMIHYQPHFWDVSSKNREPLPRAFTDKSLIYRALDISRTEQESLSFERLLREINFHFTRYGRTSHFAPGFARTVIRHLGVSGGCVFDPCCGWGGRLLGAWLEQCSYSGCELSTQTCVGLNNLSNYIGINATIYNCSCFERKWPRCDLIFTSPPFFDIEEYIGGDQPWMKCRSRAEWLKIFVRPFVAKIGKQRAALYLDDKTKTDFESIRKFNRVIEVDHRRHARRRRESEYLCVYE